MGEGKIRIGKAGLVVRRLSFSFFYNQLRVLLGNYIKFLLSGGT